MHFYMCLSAYCRSLSGQAVGRLQVLLCLQKYSIYTDIGLYISKYTFVNIPSHSYLVQFPNLGLLAAVVTLDLL